MAYNRYGVNGNQILELMTTYRNVLVMLRKRVNICSVYRDRLIALSSKRHLLVEDFKYLESKIEYKKLNKKHTLSDFYSKNKFKKFLSVNKSDELFLAKVVELLKLARKEIAQLYTEYIDIKKGNEIINNIIYSK